MEQGRGGAFEHRAPRVEITTTLHVAQEREAMTLASQAAEDRTGTLGAREIEAGGAARLGA